MVVVALTTWGQKLARKKILIHCNNDVTVKAINSGSSRNVILQECLRELHRLQTVFHCELRARFIFGVNNRISDALSRWNLHEKHQREFKNLTQHQSVKEVGISQACINFVFKNILHLKF